MSPGWLHVFSILSILLCLGCEHSSETTVGLQGVTSIPQEYKPVQCQANWEFELTDEEKMNEQGLYKVLVIYDSIYLQSLASFMIDFSNGLRAKPTKCMCASCSAAIALTPRAPTAGAGAISRPRSIFAARARRCRSWCERRWVNCSCCCSSSVAPRVTRRRRCCAMKSPRGCDTSLKWALPIFLSTARRAHSAAARSSA